MVIGSVKICDFFCENPWATNRNQKIKAGPKSSFLFNNLSEWVLNHQINSQCLPFLGHLDQAFLRKSFHRHVPLFAA